MSDGTVRVNLHCHSTFSDGVLAPEELARQLAADGVSYASLTDHDTCEGSARFRQALSGLGVGCVGGVEITARSDGREIHLLAYGIDPRHHALGEALGAERRRSDPGVQGLVDSMKRIGGRQSAARPDALSAAEAIRLAHAAGGAVFLAHPLSYGLDKAGLEELLGQLAAAGLDGMEAVYGPYAGSDRGMLAQLARGRGLAVSGGSDLHDTAIEGQAGGVELTREQWKGFRDALLHRPGSGAPVSPPGPSGRRKAPPSMRPGRFAARIVAPTALAIALFVVSIFAIIIPRFEAILLDRKREMIRELTNSVVSILAEYAADEAAGRASRAEAERDAAARIRDIRYGKEAKDYFWITDMHPTMIMHPYRPELVGSDVSGYADANGVRVFVEFVNAVRTTNEGYVEYLWQWEDDAHRIVPKLSFVKRFGPWDWVVGTGIYLDDVRAEIDGMTRRLIGLSIAIGVALSLLLAFVAQQSLAIERGRSAAEAALRDSHERYRALVEASTEGMVTVSGGACTYANATFLDMLGFTGSEIALHSFAELVEPEEATQEPVSIFLAAVSAAGDQRPSGAKGAFPPGAKGAFPPGAKGAFPPDSALSEAEVPEPCECLVRGRDGRLVDCLLTASRFELAGRAGWIVTARDLGARRRAGAAASAGAPQPYAGLAEKLGTGMFRAAWGRRTCLIEANPAARSILAIPAGADLSQVSLFPLLAEGPEAEHLQDELTARGVVKEWRLLVAGADGEQRTVSLSAVLVPGDPGSALLEGRVEDITEALRAESRREELMAEMEASSLALSAPVATLARTAATCPMNTPLRAAAARMSASSEDALLVAAQSGEILGILTDHDLRERLVASGRDPAGPVFEIMSSPLTSIPDTALLSEALLLMREADIGHLAVRSSSGLITGILRGKDLLQLHRQSLAVMKRGITEAATSGEVGACRARLPELVGSLAAGGARPASLARVIASVSDMVVERLVELAMEELGPAPAPFTFLLLGSGGREEQTLASDQDNAIIHAGQPAEPYFLALGEKVCAWLAGMGVRPCPGGIMASTAAWCAPLEQWRQYFARWIGEPDAQEMLDFNIFFDFRPAAGSRDLAAQLRRSIAGLLADHPPFFLHMARDALSARLPPLFSGGVLRDLLHTGPAEINIKDAMAPVVRFARLYALRHGIAATNTAGRLTALRDAGVLKPALCDEILRTWWFLAQLRLRGQEAARGRQGAPGGQGPTGDVLDTRGLSAGDEAMLRAAAGQITLLQKKISFDFLGSAL